MAAILALPLAHKFSQGWPLEGLGGPPIDASGFDLRLARGERFSGLTDAVRERTPPAAIVVLGADPGVHFPTLTRRKLYVSPPQDKPHPGVGEKTEDVLKVVKGYDPRILEERRHTVASLFGGADDVSRAGALSRILELGRPVAVVFAEPRHAALARWLAERNDAKRVYSDPDGSVWLFGSVPAPAGR